MSLAEVLMVPYIARKRLNNLMKNSIFKFIITLYSLFLTGVVFYHLIANDDNDFDYYDLAIFIYSLVCIFRFININKTNKRIIYFSVLTLIFDDDQLSRNEMNVLFLDVICVLIFTILEFFAKLKNENDKISCRFLKLIMLIVVFPCFIDYLVIAAVLIVSRFANLSLSEYAYKSNENSSVAPECTICKEDIVENEKVKNLKCNHLFHSACIDEWFGIRKSCPLCKQEIITGDSIRKIVTTDKF